MATRKVLVIAGLLIAGGAAVAISAPGERFGRGMGGGMMGGGFMEPWLHGEDGAGERRGGRMGHFGGSITRETFDTRVRETFARFDANSDGVVDAAEIEAGLARERGRGMGRWRHSGEGERMGEMAERLLGFLDTDRDGKVTRDEFLAEVRRRFALLDLDSDGRITDADLPPQMRGRGVLSESGSDFAMGGRGMMPFGRMLSLLRGADTNKDGAITLDEAIAAAEARFARLDRTKDGVLDAADREAFRKEMTEYRVKRILHRFGASKEGKITREQALKVAGEMFTRLDRNGDGTISRDERPFGGMRGGWGRGGHGGHGGGPGRE